MALVNYPCIVSLHLIESHGYAINMQLLSARSGLDSFFARFPYVPERLLLLDYDGTLSPFQTERNKAFPYPGVVDILSDIQKEQSTRIIIISGRATKDLLPLLRLSPTPEIWGSHGWEHIDRNGHYTIAALDRVSCAALSQAKKNIESSGLMSFCEEKPVSLAIHWRGLEPEVLHKVKRQVEENWKAIEKQSNLNVHYFDGGIELRVLGKDKGTAVTAIVEGLSEDAIVAYLGDDVTDEDAFLTLKDKALNVLVRKELRPTAADLWLRPPEELLSFLARWRQACSNVS